MLLVNGARRGNSNGGGPFGGSQARDPVYTAWLYDPRAAPGGRFRRLAASPIKRLYHSVALLLPDASVLVAGSEQGAASQGGVCRRRCFRLSSRVCLLCPLSPLSLLAVLPPPPDGRQLRIGPSYCLAHHQQQTTQLQTTDECVSTCFIPSKNLHAYQAERFLPPYAFSAARPVITGKSAEAVAMGAPLTVTFTGAATHVVLAAPAAVTHQTNMNQRLLKLATTANGGGAITVTMPPNGLVAAPGWWA